MYQFFMNNWHILLTIYIVGAVLTFIGLIAFFYWIGKAEDEDREMYPEAYPEGECRSVPLVGRRDRNIRVAECDMDRSTAHIHRRVAIWNY